MKVALATWFPANPEQPRGGVEAVSVVLAKALACNPKAELHVITLDRSVRKPEQITWQGLNIHRLPQGPGSLLRFADGTGRILVQDYLKRLKPDIVHAHDTYGVMTRGLDLPRAFTIHGFIHEDTRYRGGFARISALFWARKEKQVWSEQPHIVSISPYVRERLRGIARGVIHDIDNPVARECFSAPRAEQPGVIFSAAAICLRKNTLGLIKSFGLVHQRNPGLRLRLAGHITEPAYGDAITHYINRSGLTESVQLLGAISSAQIRQELGRASVFALVSFEEGAPMGIAEAMAAGVPVVTSNRCGMPYMLRHGESGFLVDPNDPQDIANRLEQLTANDALRAAMGGTARSSAEQSFHPDRVAQRTFRVYERASQNV